ncbi:HD domain-containing protein [Roseibium algae]|uniref:HD domain-containing protein n=1 Tax=Roseibium algae TaxID=3123038 RepID=A0ABU8TM07_9HYPH
MPLSQQIEFLLHADKLKTVVRNNKLVSGERFESSAEHSWHVTLQTLVLGGHAPKDVRLDHVLKLLTVHDLVEIEAGDHWVTEDNAAQVAEKEALAAETIFAMLPPSQRDEFKSLWWEFEESATAEAKFANAMDALHPILIVFSPNASGFCHTALSAEFIRKKKRPKLEPYPDLWAYAQTLLEDAVKKGNLIP